MSKNVRPVPKPVLPNAPIRQNERQHYINTLITLYKTSHEGLSTTKIISRAVDCEFKVASSNKQRGEYLSQIKRLMFNIKKYGSEDGKPRQSQNQAQDQDGDQTQKSDNHEKDYGVAGKYGYIHSFDAVYNHLKSICISKERLQRHAYVMDIPSSMDLPIMVDCDHCQRSFQLSQISQKVECNFHPGKILTSTYENLNLGKKIYGTQYTDRTYTCCKQPKGQSLGCQRNDHHVFKLKEKGQLQQVKPFKSIASLRREFGIDNESNIQKKRRDKIQAVGLDCEMCYTNKGFEMMKVSLIDFKTQKLLIDTIVHPDGDLIIDLNSHVSGVDSIPNNAMTFDEVLVKIAELTDEDTILIGHGLENDLNVLRLIYPNIVDTAILLSENQIDIRRKDPLKKIAWDYLSENIQSGSHDSLEDAVVPIRIIKKYISMRLDRMKSIK